jgi:hypothetical protein
MPLNMASLISVCQPSVILLSSFGVAVTDRMGLDLLPILPRALPSGQAVAVVGQRARPQQHCQNGQFVLLIQCL